MADRCRNLGTQPLGAVTDAGGSLWEGEVLRQAWLGPVPVRHRDNRAVVGERRSGRDERVGVGGRAEPLEPALSDLHIGVDEHDVGTLNGIHRVVAVSNEAEVLGVAHPDDAVLQ